MTTKPKHRSKLRLWAGKRFYTFKKYYYWHFSSTHFADTREKDLSIEVSTHKTILMRKLKNVDMWMQENKITNLKIALRKLNGIVINPGETFSFWRQIGNPTKRKGYVNGMVLHNGKVKSGMGGGLCQLSNLLFWMTLHTPLTVIERWRHSYDVFPDVNRKQPFGSGATCAYPNIDLQIKNNTKQKFQLSLEINDKYLIGKWLSHKEDQYKYQIIEKDHLIKHEFWGGYTRNNKLFRKIIDKKTNLEMEEEFITENKAIMMYNPLLEYKLQS
ncbi:VanW family protein [Patescibacteria group bacterium]